MKEFTIMPAQRRLMLVLAICGVAMGALTQRPAMSDEAPPGAAPAPEPLSLEQAVTTALTLSPLLYQAEQQLLAARDGVTQARAAGSVTAEIGVTHTRISEVSAFTSKDNTNGTVTVAKPLYTGGRIPAATRQARAGADATQAELQRARQTVTYDVKRAYYGALVAADFVAVAEGALASAREHLRVAQAGQDAGVAPRFDVLRAKARVAQSEQALIEARNGLNLARAALSNVMGVGQDREFALTTPLAEPTDTADLDLAALTSRAQEARPEVHQTQALIEAAGAGVSLARSAKHPTLGVAWVYSRVLETSAFQVSNWTLALTAGLNIFDGRQTSAAVSRARHERERARGLLEQVRQGIALQVRQAYLDLDSARERIAAATTGVTEAEEAHRVAGLRYQAGVGISVEVIDAEVAVASAGNDYARAVYDYNVAAAQLEYAVGASAAAAPAEGQAQ
jgi:outer membrane protein TolC